MSLEDVIQQTPIILPEHRKEFRGYLEKLPDELERWLYQDDLASNGSLYQGDILLDLPMCFIDEEGDVTEGVDCAALISNTCDMQPGRKDSIIASPVIPLNEYEEQLLDGGSTGVENTMKDIRNNNIFSYFYLPQKNGFSESFIDFSRMISINSTYANTNCLERRLLSLSQYGFYFFLIKLTFHFARRERFSS